jgi:5-methylcytosine-specific restriction endonuclease McrA
MYLKENNLEAKQILLTLEILEVGGSLKKNTPQIIEEICSSYDHLIGMTVSADWLIRYYKAQNVTCSLIGNDLVLTLTDSLIKRARTPRKGYTQKQINLVKMFTGEGKGGFRRLRRMRMSLTAYLEFKRIGATSASNRNKDKKKLTKKQAEYKKQSEKFFKSREWRQLRYDALKLHGRKCQCCGATPETTILHVDHIKPRSKYPELQLSVDNLQVLCEDCNIGKSNLHEDDFRK